MSAFFYYYNSVCLELLNLPNMSDKIYYNVPIVLFKDFLTNHTMSLSDALYYQIYSHSLKLETGTKLEKFVDSAKYWNVKLGNEKEAYKKGKELYEAYPEKNVMVGINSSIFWDFYNNEKKTEFDKIVLLGFLAIKSILGPKSYCKTNNNFWLSRMSGLANSVSDLNNLPVNIKKYSTEYQTKKIKNELSDNWGLKTYSFHTRGFYVSFKLSMEQLITEAEKNRKSAKEKQRKTSIKEIRQNVLKKLDDENRNNQNKPK